MAVSNLRLLNGLGLAVMAVGAGAMFSRLFPERAFNFHWKFLGILGLVSISAAILVSLVFHRRSQRAIVGGGLLLYSLAVVFYDPYLALYEVHQVLLAAFLVVPLFVLVGWLAKERDALGVLGASAILFGASAMFYHNTSTSERAIGFSSRAVIRE